MGKKIVGMSSRGQRVETGEGVDGGRGTKTRSHRLSESITWSSFFLFFLAVFPAFSSFPSQHFSKTPRVFFSASSLVFIQLFLKMLVSTHFMKVIKRKDKSDCPPFSFHGIWRTVIIGKLASCRYIFLD